MGRGPKQPPSFLEARLGFVEPVVVGTVAAKTATWQPNLSGQRPAPGWCFVAVPEALALLLLKARLPNLTVLGSLDKELVPRQGLSSRHYSDSVIYS